MKMRSWLLAVAVAAGALAPAAGPAAIACAAETPRAALVVDTGTGRVLEMCVKLNEPEVSGIDFIKLANKQFDLQYRLGYGGKGVCQLANVPSETPSEQCFEDSNSFWGYWRGDGSGGWSWSSQGADSTQVADGSIEGWSYGPRNADGTNERPRPRSNGDPYTFDSVCLPNDDPAEGDDKKEDEPADQKKDEEKGGAGHGFGNFPNFKAKPKEEKTPDPAVTPKSEPDDRLLDSAPDVSELELAPTPAGSPSELPAGATSERVDTENDLPLAGALALAATIAMALIAVYLVRRRTPVPPEE